MSRRTAVLALCLLCLSSLAAAASSEPLKAPAPTAPSSVTVANAPAADLSWLLHPGTAAISQEPAANDLFGATPAVTCMTCLCRCIQSGEDAICCRYLCHPIGMNPC